MHKTCVRWIQIKKKMNFIKLKLNLTKTKVNWCNEKTNHTYTQNHLTVSQKFEKQIKIEFRTNTSSFG